jgi:hypothetical protein
VRHAGRLAFTLALVGLFTIAGLAALAGLKYSAFLAESVGERLEIVATTAATDLETAIDLGLSLDEVANAEAILERARSHDPAISGIAVFDLDGSVLHAVGDAPTGTVHPRTAEGFRVVVLEGVDDAWSIEADQRIRSGVVVTGSFGQPVAGVVAHYPVTEVRALESAMLGSLTFDAIWIGILLVLGVGLLHLLVRRQSRVQGGTT